MPHPTHDTKTALLQLLRAAPGQFVSGQALADRLGIPTQTKTLVAGGNDAGAYQKLRGGAACVNISAACRCLHSPCVIADLGDIDAVEKLAFALAEELGK